MMIKKSLMLLATFFLCGIAQADHHRTTHLPVLIDDLVLNLENAEANLAFHEATVVLTGDESFFVFVITAYSDLLQDRAIAGKVLLQDPANLDEARKVFNQKDDNMCLLCATNTASISFGVGALVYYTAILNQTSHSAASTQATIDLMQAWLLLDQIHWHIQDAIREEVYFDPQFSE